MSDNTNRNINRRPSRPPRKNSTRRRSRAYIKRMKRIRRIKLALFITAFALVIILAISFFSGAFNSPQPNTNNVETTVNVEATTTPVVNNATTLEQYAQANNLSLNLWPDYMVNMFNKNPEARDFVFNYPTMKDQEFEIDLSEYANTEGIPLLMQWDQRWGYSKYGEDIIAVSGCGPTSLSMVCIGLLGDTSLDPKTIAEFSMENNYCAPGNGTFWTLMSEGAPRLGIYTEEVPLDENALKEKLEAGYPVICVVGPGDFTDGGHYMVMTDYIDGKIKINDPNSRAKTDKLWSYADIESQIENLWACSVG